MHESNAVPGLTTKMLEGSVNTIMVGFEESRANYRHPDRVEVTGTPVRVDFLDQDKAAARRELGIPEGKPLDVYKRQAENKSRELRHVASDYVDDILRRSEESLAAALNEVRGSRSQFRTATGTPDAQSAQQK